MPTNPDQVSLGGVAALLSEARMLYETLLPHITQEAARDALCGVIAVREALRMRIEDVAHEAGFELRGSGHPGAVDAQCLILQRLVAQGELNSALREIEHWDARLRDAVRQSLRNSTLSAPVSDNLAFIVRILDVAPAAFPLPDARRREAAA